MLEKHENRQDGRQPRGTRLVTELVIEGPKKHGGQGLMAWKQRALSVLQACKSQGTSPGRGPSCKESSLLAPL